MNEETNKNLADIVTHLNSLCILKEMELRLAIMNFNRQVNPSQFGAGLLTFEQLIAELPSENDEETE